MNSEWKQKLNKLKQLELDPARVSRQREWLLTRVASEAGDEKQVSDLKAFFLLLSHPYVLKPLAYVAAVVLLLVSGSVYTMSAAINSHPGNTFYPVKVQLEKWQTSLLTTSEVDKVQKQMEFADRRLQELSSVVKDSQSPFDRQAQVAEVAKHLNSSLQEVKDSLVKAATEDKGAGEEVVKVAQLVKEKSADIQEKIDHSYQDLPVEVRSVLIKEAEEVQLSALSVLVEKYNKYRDQIDKNDLQKQLSSQIANLSSRISLLPTEEQEELLAELKEAEKYLTDEKFSQALDKIKQVSSSVEEIEKQGLVLGVEELADESSDGDGSTSTATSTDSN